MAVPVKGSNKEFEKMGTGLKQAVCAFVVPLGLQGTPWGDKDKVVIGFEFKKRMSNGEPFVLCKEYNRTLSRNSNLRNDLESWRGIEFTPDEIENGIDLEKLVGVNAMLDIVEKQRQKGGTREDIGHISRLPSEYEVINPTRSTPPEWVVEKAEQGRTLSEAPAAQVNQTEDLPF